MKTTPTTTAVRSSTAKAVDHANGGQEVQSIRTRLFNGKQPVSYPEPEDQDPEVSRTTDDPPVYGESACSKEEGITS